jgi:hypothetical protein
MSSTAFAAPDPHRLARAFLALGDDGFPDPVRRSLVKVLAVLAATLVLAVAAPLSWMAPAVQTPQKAADQPAATLGNSKAALTAADDEDDVGGH